MTAHTPNLPRLTLRWVMLLGALFVLGPIAGHLINTLRAPDGSTNATPLVSTSPAMGIVDVVVVMALALGIGVVSGRVFGPRLGLRTAGFVVAWAAWLTGTIDAILRRTQDAAPMWTLAIEGVVAGAMGLAVFLMIVAVSRPHNEPERTEFARSSLGDLRRMASVGALVALVGAVVGGGVVAWIVAFEPLKGQTVMAAFLGGIAAAAIGRLAVGVVDREAPVAVYFIAIVVLAIASPASAALVAGSDAALIDASYDGTMFPLGFIMPLDWLAGGLLGVPIGLAWVGSMLDKHEG